MCGTSILSVGQKKIKLHKLGDTAVYSFNYKARKKERNFCDTVNNSVKPSINSLFNTKDIF